MEYIKTPLKVASYLGSKMALPATVLSTTQLGNYAERVGGSVIDLAQGAYSLTAALIQNRGSGTVAADLMNSGLAALANLGENIVNHPKETAIAAGITYGACKVPRMVMKFKSKRNVQKLRKENARLRSQLRTA